jgi:hypothetical protein
VFVMVVSESRINRASGVHWNWELVNCLHDSFYEIMFCYPYKASLCKKHIYMILNLARRAEGDYSKLCPRLRAQFCALYLE